jgi:predicted DNA-binding transcriptional regulator AlpA
MTLNNATTDEFLDTSDAAEVLGISPRTMEDWRWRGGGPPFYKLGQRMVRYRRQDILAFALKSQRQNTGATK